MSGLERLVPNLEKDVMKLQQRNLSTYTENKTIQVNLHIIATSSLTHISKLILVGVGGSMFTGGWAPCKGSRFP